MDKSKAVEMWWFAVEEYFEAIKRFRENQCAITLNHMMARSHDLRVAEIAMFENGIAKPTDALTFTELHYLMMNRWYHAKAVAILNSKPFESEPIPVGGSVHAVLHGCRNARYGVARRHAAVPWNDHWRARAAGCRSELAPAPWRAMRAAS